jgi:hypothetical protein
MKNQIVGAIAAVVIAVMAVATTGVSAQSQGTTSGITVPIVGSGGGSTFAGQLNVQRFVRSGSQILAVGTITGALTNTLTGVVSTVIKQVSIPLDLGGSSALNGKCEILSLVLGPLDLDLLGLQVHLNQVVLNIDAQSGPGNLLGNLLCAVAGLLDGSGPLGQITSLLNQILGALG